MFFVMQGCEVQPRLITEFLIGQPGLRNCRHLVTNPQPRSILFTKLHSSLTMATKMFSRPLSSVLFLPNSILANH